jgi:hypothetical protein
MEGLLARLVCLPLCNQGAISFAHLQGERNPLHVAVGSQNVALITALSTQVTMITLAPAVRLPAHSFQAHPDPVVEIGAGVWYRDFFANPSRVRPNTIHRWCLAPKLSTLASPRLRLL